jgi:hypothetical protein
VTFEVSVAGSEALFADLPAVDPVTGDLTYRPQITVTPTDVPATIVARDNGQGTPASAPQNFTITINP